jgi:hypothetical protein
MQNPPISPQSRPFPSQLFTQLVKPGHLEPTVPSNARDIEESDGLELQMTRATFALGEFGDFQYTECCFVSTLYVNI